MTEPIRFYRATGKYGFLSNLYILPPPGLQFEGSLFDCAERAYQFGKPKDKATAEWLVLAPKPHLCAGAAHSLLLFDVMPGWNQSKVKRMRRILRAKFTQYPDLAKKLVATGDAALVEASNVDAFWGVGKRGNGKNMLGILLMELRSSLLVCEHCKFNPGVCSGEVIDGRCPCYTPKVPFGGCP